MPTSSSSNNAGLVQSATNAGSSATDSPASKGASLVADASASAITYKNLLRQICIETMQMFGVSESDSAALVLYSHGPWPATPREPTIVAKTGYRMYFQRIFVDQPTHRRYLTRLANEIRRSLGAVPPMCPAGTTWPDIISAECATWDRARLLGTVKLRRNLLRQYKFIGIFDAAAAHAESSGWDQQTSQLYTSDVRRMMYGQMVRVWDCNLALPRAAPPPSSLLSTTCAGATAYGSASDSSNSGGGGCSAGGGGLTSSSSCQGDGLSSPPPFSLGSPVEAPPSCNNSSNSRAYRQQQGFFGRKGSFATKRRGVLRPLDSDEDDGFLSSSTSQCPATALAKGERNFLSVAAASAAPAVTPVLKPLRPRDPAKDVMLDNCFRIDRYFTALEGLEVPAVDSPQSE